MLLGRVDLGFVGLPVKSGPRESAFSLLLGSLAHNCRLRSDPYDPQRTSVLQCGGCGGRSTAPLHSRAVRGENGIAGHLPRPSARSKLHTSTQITNQIIRELKRSGKPIDPYRVRDELVRRTRESKKKGSKSLRMLCTPALRQSYCMKRPCGVMAGRCRRH